MKKPCDTRLGNSALTRRNFMKAGGAAVAASAVPLHAGASDKKAPAGEEKPAIRKYRRLGRTSFEVSDISMGCGSVGEPNVVRYAYDHGINFFDTAESYGNGDSEKKIGQAIEHLDREEVFIVTKLHFEKDEEEKDILDRFKKCQERLNTKYVDALYMHGVSDVDLVKHKGFHSAVGKLKADGRVKHAGISSHGPRGEGDSMQKVLLAAVEDGRFDLMLLVYNFLNHEEGKKVIEACKDRDVGVTIMKATPGEISIEPFDPENPTGEYAEIMEKFEKRGMSREKAVERIEGWIARRKPNIEKTKPFIAKYGLKTEDELDARSVQWVLDNPDVSTVCISLRDFDLIDKYVPLSGTRLEKAGLEFLRDYRHAFGEDYCRHGCTRCLASCAHGIPVSTIMRYAQYFHRQGLEKSAMARYQKLPGRNGSLCLDCRGDCAGACPFGVDIQASVVKAHAMLTMV